MRRLSTLPRGTKRLYGICLHLAVGASIWGYNIGILSSVLVHPGWREALDDPTPARIGLIISVYYLGTFLSFMLLSHPLADYLGRRRAAIIGTCALCLGAMCMAAANGGAAVGIMALGRWICGVGVGVVSTAVPLYQRCEHGFDAVFSNNRGVARQGERQARHDEPRRVHRRTGLWPVYPESRLKLTRRRVGYGTTFWTSDAGRYWGWRDSILLQCVPAAVFLAGLFFLPETPRWLLEKGDGDAASQVLHYLREEAMPAEAITHELHAISADVESRRKAGTTFVSLSLSLFRDASLFARLWRAFLLQFMAQMCGATAIKYYLPTLLKALGLEYRLALMAGAAEMTVKIAMTVVEMWAIDRFGRRACMTGGSLIMGVAMLVSVPLPLGSHRERGG
ncbi:Quinate permease [Metarhizium anisopliae]|nr:Quinate permease [Metarhizium anisopliae]